MSAGPGKRVERRMAKMCPDRGMRADRFVPGALSPLERVNRRATDPEERSG